MYIDKKLAPQLTDVTLKSIDQSVVNWFERDYPIVIDGKKVPVLYATAERWARSQKEKGFRDEAGVLILPIVSIRRTTPDPKKERYAPESDETNITLTRRLATTPISDNDRQSVNQDNRVSDETFLKTADAPIYEVLQIPYPSFVNLDYDVHVWTSYLTHQNLEQENIFREFKGGRQWFRVGDYYFFGTLKQSTDRSNLENFSDSERVIKYQFLLRIEAYLIDKRKIKSFRTSGNVKVRITETSIELK